MEENMGVSEQSPLVGLMRQEKPLCPIQGHCHLKSH